MPCNSFLKSIFKLVEAFSKGLESNRISVNGIEPRGPCGLAVAPHRAPHQRVALEARPKCQLPNTIPGLVPVFGLQISQLVPNTAAGSVSESMKCHSRSLHVALAELKVPL